MRIFEKCNFAHPEIEYFRTFLFSRISLLRIDFGFIFAHFSISARICTKINMREHGLLEIVGHGAKL